MSTKRNRKGMGGWSAYHRSAEFRELADAALARFRARRHLLPKCGAAKKSDGAPCQNLPLENGRCRLHGGKTPKGDNWHRPRWPESNSPVASQKLHAKLEALERARRRRKARIARMSEAERTRHELWHHARPVGSKEARRAVRLERIRNTDFAKICARTPAAQTTKDPEYIAIEAEIAAVKEKLALLGDFSPPEARDELEWKVFG
ncbi:HGGxSTG domain-containing protein [Pacificitalea manganoxidans]|nr:HGGxSTG domain-containing protein [Pacificitalea manganoxidans]MDR6308235.1 hypothetical protein [Pacificitalea manganoxidans]